jgi:excisionase family DNA binding protein
MTAVKETFMPPNRNNKSFVGAVHFPALLTREDAAAYLKCTPKYIDNQIRAGRLRALKPTGKLVRIRLSDIDEFLQAGASVAA